MAATGANGSVSEDNGGIASCTSSGGDNCSGVYADDSSIVLTATPETGYFTSWDSGCSSTNGNICTVSEISKNTTVAVSFTNKGAGSDAAVPLPLAASLIFGLLLLAGAFRMRKTRAKRN